MTFVFTDYETLKAKFNDCVAFVLKRDKKEKIDYLHSRRRDELQFLTAVINELDARIDAAKINEATPDQRAKLLKPYADILYGAMNVVNQDIVNRFTSYESGSRVLDRLNIAMGISDSQRPDPEQFVTMYQSLNQFLKLIYEGDDSRNGFKKEHALQSVPVAKLVAFANISYAHEKDAQINVNAKLERGGKSHADESKYKPTKKTYASIVARFSTLNDLHQALHQLILTETAAKDISDISKLDKDRAIQLDFLTSLSTALSAPKAAGIKEAEKIAILAGAMYLVRGQIAQGYGKDPLTHDDILATLLQGGSVVHTELTKILGAKETLVEDIEELIAAASQFIRHMTVESKETKGGRKEIVRTNHLFSAIKDFSLESFLTLALDMIQSCRTMALAHCVVEMNKEIEAAKPKEASSSSYASGLLNWWNKKTAPEAEEDEDDELEEHRDASTTATSSTVPH